MSDEIKNNIPEEEDNIVELIAQDDAGEDIYVSVDDDDVTQKVFDLFLEAMDAEDED